MSQHVPFADLPAQMREVEAQVETDILATLRNCDFVGGAAVARFEEAYARFVGVDHCVGLGNGTDAVELALRAVGVGPGAEVIVPANTFVATVEAVARIGAIPVLVDVFEDTLLMRPDAASAAVTARTAAIVPVHLFGQLADMASLHRMAGGIPLVEDAAQSQGARQRGRVSGAFGNVAATSFYPGKNLGAAGDAGAITTNDSDIARKIRLLANHGSLTKYHHEVLGFNSRLDTIQAHVLFHKLARLPEWNALRRQAADRYASALTDIVDLQLPSVAPHNEHVWHLYVVRHPERDRLLDHLAAAGIGHGIHYPYPVHLTPAFAAACVCSGDLSVSERAAQTMVSLPMFPHITAAQQEVVVGALREFVSPDRAQLAR